MGDAPTRTPPTRMPAAPPWLAPIERLVLAAARTIQPLAVLTPIAARSERERLVKELRAKRRMIPRWTYAPRHHRELRAALDAAERELATRAEGPLDGLYLERVRELALDAALCAAGGTREIATLARQRFDPAGRALAGAASALCTEWLAEPAPAARAGATIASDASDPASLLSQMVAAVGHLRLPFAVMATPALTPLAATGENVILVAAGRLVHEEDARRTVLHEVEGHARPRARAESASSPLFRAGTARGADDQEGRAVLLEQRAGLLGLRRRRQLAARHRAVESMHAGASFADVARILVDLHGVDEAEAVLVAERVFRGGDGTYPGLGRERIYLESFIRVRARLHAKPEDDHVLACGQVAVEAIDALRPWAHPFLEEPRL